RAFTYTSNVYAGMVARVLRISVVALLVYVALLGLTWWGFQKVPGGFIPAQDQGYAIVSIQLPGAASLSRTSAVTKQVEEIAMNTPGVGHAVALVGCSGATRSNSPSAAAVFVILDDFNTRGASGPSADEVIAELRGRMTQVNEAQVVVIPPPPV